MWTPASAGLERTSMNRFKKARLRQMNNVNASSQVDGGIAIAQHRQQIRSTYKPARNMTSSTGSRFK
jgi:hypothetical protein